MNNFKYVPVENNSLSITKVKEACNKALGEFVTKVQDDEMVWVEGYKGTDSNMCCRGYQYEIGKIHSMPDGEEISVCNSGFHLCLSLHSVFAYYAVGDGNRFFKVRALVRKSEYEKVVIAKGSPSLYLSAMYSLTGSPDKLTSKYIEFIEELSVDEILQALEKDISDWTEEEKKIAIEDSPNTVHKERRLKKEAIMADELTSLGYSKAFAAYLVKEGMYEEACAVGSQPDLSMDMRVLTILMKKYD